MKSIVSIGPKQIANVTFQLTAEPDAASKLYKVPLSIIYKDDLGRNYSKDNVISLAVGDIPEMRFTVDSSTIYKAKQAGTVTIKAANTGLGDIKFLNIRLQESDAYTIISPAEVYVGNIDSDDYETADFKLYALSKDLTLPLTITYMDANNQQYVENIDLAVPLYSTSQAKKLGLAQGNGFVGYLIIIIIVGAGYYWYRKRKKRAKK